ncbi:hypothetical protein GCM10012275_62730 [Longimycelium tulufanense]|uniref:DUF397 domain-containing protein n=1 Tax=Longimycelium tulufanense TaxID=907463 RepID=A0A8J3CKQ9_9PSEU|nr:DUF397 domain-containing protein [Longimycelium tulufanense]GGM83577.1 hypothetical protein GCM10012275_62730 [Longimycelium tulufanense]
MPHAVRDTGWLKSSRSNSGGDNCVEVRLTGTSVGIRDSKSLDAGTLWVTPSIWSLFVGRAKLGELDLPA